MVASYLLIPYSLVPDLVDYYRHKSGEYHESVIFGMWLTSHQFGIAMAGIILGGFLQVMGYDGSREIQNAQAILAVRFALGMLPGIFFVLSTLLLQRYGVSRQIYQKIQKELQQAQSPSANAD
jgi:GPH family glycoside/pentoside/hexuronide:cation symporter